MNNFQSFVKENYAELSNFPKNCIAPNDNAYKIAIYNSQFCILQIKQKKFMAKISWEFITLNIEH